MCNRSLLVTNLYDSILPDVLPLQYIRFCNLITDSGIWRHIVVTENGTQTHTRLGPITAHLIMVCKRCNVELPPAC